MNRNVKVRGEWELKHEKERTREAVAFDFEVKETKP